MEKRSSQNFGPVFLQEKVDLSFDPTEAKRVSSLIRTGSVGQKVLDFFISKPGEEINPKEVGLVLSLSDVAHVNRCFARKKSKLRIVRTKRAPRTGGWRHRYRLGTLK